MSGLRQICTFFLAGDLIGLDARHVREVLQYQEMTRVPLSPSVVSGLINLRGEIVTAIDLRTRLDLPPRDSDCRPMNVVVRDDTAPVSLLVDEIGDVLEVTEDMYEAAPEHLEGAARDLILGTYQLPHRLLLMLDLKNVMNLDGSTGLTRTVQTNQVEETASGQAQ